MVNDRPKAALTPCTGRCSTVFGDDVCRGCRRFSHEVIHWNRYTQEEQATIWLRLDQQIDKILMPLLPHYHYPTLQHFLAVKHAKLLPDAGLGRKLYHALKLCEKSPIFVEESGLGIQKSEIKPIWKEFEKRVLVLAQASYELAFLRAAMVSHNLLKENERE